MGEVIVLFSDYCELRRRGGRIYIRNRKAECSYPAHMLDVILIYGKTTVTSDVLDLCLENGIALVLMSQTGRIRGVLSNFLDSAGIKLRLRQYELYKTKSIEVAKCIIHEKIKEIENIYNLQFDEIENRLKSAKSLQEILQLEAHASKQMFRILAKRVKECGFNFQGREYHPPRDEVNSLLSFVYTLGYTFSKAYLLAKGLDPYLSFLHRKKGTHASFASDVMEVIRPDLTKFVENLLTTGKVTILDFERTSDDTILISRHRVEAILEDFSDKSKVYASKIRDLLERILSLHNRDNKK